MASLRLRLLLQPPSSLVVDSLSPATLAKYAAALRQFCFFLSNSSATRSAVRVHSGYISISSMSALDDLLATFAALSSWLLLPTLPAGWPWGRRLRLDCRFSGWLALGPPPLLLQLSIILYLL